MEDFTTYLIKNRFVEKTRQRMLYCSNHYLQWLAERNIAIQEATYKDLLNYIGDLQKEKSKQFTNEHLRAVSHYNRFLQLPDIAYQVRGRGIEKQQYVMFNDEELNHIYDSYEPKAQKGFWRYSDKILLGFTIYQALDERDIERLEIGHLNLQTGKLEVPEATAEKRQQPCFWKPIRSCHYITTSKTTEITAPKNSSVRRQRTLPIFIASSRR